MLPTPSQTVGPFFGYALPYDAGPRLVGQDDPDAIRLAGTVLDGAGDPVGDALLEIWQADRAGRYAHPADDRREPPPEQGFGGFGRCPTDEQGRFAFVTVKPGPVPGPEGVRQAPHVNLAVFARGLLRQVVSRIYFPDEQAANAADPVLSSIAEPTVRASLVARHENGGYRFDVHLQGDRETAFFAF